MSAGASDQPLLSVAKKVLRAAVGVGVEVAGHHILGPTAWSYFKRIVTPVFEKLEERYPKLFLSEEDSSQAIDALSNDAQLQDLLTQGFMQLGEGQTILMAELNRMNMSLERVGRTVTDTHEMTAEILAILREEREARPTNSLQEVTSLVDLERTVGPELAPYTRFNLAHSFHLNEVLENGAANATYRFFLSAYWSDDEILHFEPTEYRVQVFGKYTDEEGRTCRDIEESYAPKGKWQPLRLREVRLTNTQTQLRRTGKEVTFCRVQGRWLLKV